RPCLAELVGVGLGAVAARLDARPGYPPPRSRRPVLEDALHLPLARDDALETRLHRPLNEILPRLAVLDELMQERGGQRGAMVALVLEDDLGQGDRCQVLAGRGVDHRDLFSGANHLLDLLEGDVAALLSVVELSVRVPLDDVRHGTPSTGWLRRSL